MNRLDRTARSAGAIALLLVCSALVAAPADAMACAGRPTARVPTRMVLASPSPNEDEAAKSSATQKPPSQDGQSGAAQGSSTGAASQQKQ